MDENLTPQAEQGATTPVAHGGTASLWLRRGVCVALALFGVAVICKLGGELIFEFRDLSGEWAVARNREPMGYIGIATEQPDLRPESCIREDENGRRLLWAGRGKPGQAGWFDVTATDLPLREFRFAFGRDKVRAIDFPIFQPPDGDIPRKLYPERPMIGLYINGDARAYPITVLSKCEVVNETIGNRAVAVTFCSITEQPAIYDRTLNGKPISFGSSGYCYLDLFVLYDRGTDSLWWPKEQGLTAITGPLVGSVLPALDRSAPTTWGEWRRKHPDTKVLVGADRSRGVPLPGTSEVATRPE